MASGARSESNRLSGEPSSQLHERHDESDFDTKTQDKLAAAN
jgi:GSH-dependent disulfide-bond oxidoreductase